jgi:hypothetical protein
MVATFTSMVDETLTDEVIQREELEFILTPALKFWRAVDPSLKAEADEWKKLSGCSGGGRAGFMR